MKVDGICVIIYTDWTKRPMGSHKGIFERSLHCQWQSENALLRSL